MAVRCGITAERPLMGVLCVFVEENNLLVWSVTCGVALSKPAAWELLALVKEHLTHLPILYFSQHLSKKRKNGWQAWKWHWACYLLIKPWIGAQKGCQACLLQSPKTQECLYCVWGLHWANRFQSLLVTGWTLTGQRQHLTVCSTYKSVFKVSLMSASVHLIPCEDNKICHGPFELLLLQESTGSTQLCIPPHTFALNPIMLP